ncbi:MAG: hypothetical protein IRY87_16215 [Acetobacteraceae bacterium]|nr:hypothetical protein [Acetobacteraceae bacterium]
MNAQTAKEQLEWTKQYFENVLQPLAEREDQRAQQAMEQQTQEYEDNRARALLQDERYRQYGIPAEDRYYQMVNDFSSEAEQERQANLAQADVVNAAQVQQQNLQRQFAAAGIDPTSPAAISAATDASVMNAATQAAAVNQARDAARKLGMALTGDAANFGRGIQSNVATFSQLASGNSMNAGATGQQSLANSLGMGSFMQQGYGLANQAYGQNLSSLVADSNALAGRRADRRSERCGHGFRHRQRARVNPGHRIGRLRQHGHRSSEGPFGGLEIETPHRPGCGADEQRAGYIGKRTKS